MEKYATCPGIWIENMHPSAMQTWNKNVLKWIFSDKCNKQSIGGLNEADCAWAAEEKFENRVVPIISKNWYFLCVILIWLIWSHVFLLSFKFTWKKYVVLISLLTSHDLKPKNKWKWFTRRQRRNNLCLFYPALLVGAHYRMNVRHKFDAPVRESIVQCKQ